MAQTKPKAGQFFGVSGNGTDGQFLQTDGTGGMAWADTTVAPTLTSIDYPGTQTAADPAGGESIIINGTGFQTGITCTIGGTSATTAFNSATQITITSPAKAAGQYTVEVTNTDGGSGSSANFIQYSGVPVWSTNSGSLGSVMEGGTTSFQVTATEGSDTIEYAVTSGSLPSGYSLATATGAITGTAGAVSADTTSTFSITATDDENQTSSARSFSITVTNDVPSNYFNAVLYSGTGANLSISSLNFQPDLTWIKNTGGSYNHALYDSVRGVEKPLSSNTSAAQDSDVGDTYGLKSFDTQGFTLGYNGAMTNSSGNNFVSWNWKAGGAPTATNAAAAGSVPTLGSVMIDGVASTAALAGTIPAKKMSVNTTLGFSIVEFEGNATSGATIAHGLGGDADMVIVKSTNLGQAWNVYIKDVTDTDSKYLRLNTTDSIASLSTSNYRFIVNNFSSTVFSVGSDNAVNGNGDDYVTYCFKSTTGFSKVGSYTGNGSAAGPIVETGFEPAFIMIKNTGLSTAGSYWAMYDNKRTTSNPRGTILRANDSGGNFSADSLDINFLSNGFQVTGTYDAVNDSGENFVYLAIAADTSTATPALANSFNAVENTSPTTNQAIAAGFTPDMVWIKGSNIGSGNPTAWGQYDTIRGSGIVLQSDNGDAQYDYSGHPSGDLAMKFTSTGYNTPPVVNGNINNASDDYINYFWKAGGLGSINTDGTITSVVSANQAAGFSITQYTGNDTQNATVGLGLGAQAELVIIKNIDQSDAWFVGSTSLNANNFLELDGTYAATTNSDLNYTINTDTIQFTSANPHDMFNASGERYIAYSWRSIANFSKVGTYTASGSAGSPTITTGFQPGFVLIKNIDRSQEWIVIDSVRGLNKSLQPDSTAAESVNGNIITTNATSFTIDVNGGGINYASGDTMLYMAFKIN